MPNDDGNCETVATVKARRGAISSTTSLEVNDPVCNVEKDSRTVQLLAGAVKDNLLFSRLDENERQQIFNAMFPRSYSPNEIIVYPDEQDEYFHVVEEGEVHVYIDDQLMTSFHASSCFGELALIQSRPLAMTIKAASHVKLWSLLGETYRKILMDITISNRAIYEEFLTRVPILRTLNEAERFTVADSLESVQYADGEVVVKQGDSGDAFFIIVEGNCTVYQKANEYSSPVEIDTLGPGDYFGEIALLCNRARVATLMAKGVLKCVKIDRTRFERVLGPIREILQRNIPRYNSIVALDQLQATMTDEETKECQ